MTISTRSFALLRTTKQNQGLHCAQDVNRACAQDDNKKSHPEEPQATKDLVIA